MLRPLRVACLGLGWVGQHRHIPALMRNPSFQLVGVIDRHPLLAEKVARRHKLPHFSQTDDLSQVPWLDQVDAVSIAAPPLFHEALATTALRLGKHVLTEKPFAMSLTEGETMRAVARDNKRVLAVMHNFQFSRAAGKLRCDLAKNKFGAIRRIAAVQLGNPRRRLPVWFEQLPLGLFYDESPHFFYLLRWLAGGSLRLQHAHGIASPLMRGNTPSSVSLLYRNAENIPVTIDCQFDSAVSEWFVMVTGERYLGILDIFRDIYIRLPNDGSHSLPQILRTSAFAVTQHLWQHIPNGFAFLRGRLDYGNDEVFRRFARAIQKNREPEDIDAEAALAVLRLQHEATAAITQSLYR